MISYQTRFLVPTRLLLIHYLPLPWANASSPTNDKICTASQIDFWSIALTVWSLGKWSFCVCHCGFWLELFCSGEKHEPCNDTIACLLFGWLGHVVNDCNVDPASCALRDVRKNFQNIKASVGENRWVWISPSTQAKFQQLPMCQTTHKTNCTISDRCQK